MTRRAFVELTTLAGGEAVLSGLSACGGFSQAPSPSASVTSGSAGADATASTSASVAAATASASSSDASGAAPQVYFTHKLNSESMQAVFAAIGQGLGNGRIGVKLSTGEPGAITT